MSRRTRVGSFGASLTLLLLPACCGILPLDQVPSAEPPEAQSLSGETMPAVQVGRQANTMGPVRSWLTDVMGTETASRRLEPPVPMAAAVVPAQAEPAKVLPVRMTTVSPEPETPALLEASKLPPPLETTAAATDSPLIEALRCYQNQSPEQAVKRLDGCDRTSKELLACLLPVAVRLADGDLASADPQDLATLVEQVQSLLLPLRERAALEIPKLCFCRPVAAPGRSAVYELLEENHLFRPGEMVALYLEVRNFSCPGQGEDYRTHVVTSVVIQDEHGHRVNPFGEPMGKADVSLSPRQDYCNGLRFALPALPPGAYTLWLTATDVPSGRTAKRSLDFRVTTVPARGN